MCSLFKFAITILKTVSFVEIPKAIDLLARLLNKAASVMITKLIWFSGDSKILLLKIQWYQKLTKWSYFWIKMRLQCALVPSFLATESPSKLMENVFLFILKILKVFLWLFGHVEKHLDEKDNVNFTIYDVTTPKTNNYNKRLAQYLKT